MPTDIYFSGESVRIKVDEDPDRVAEALSSSEGLPVRLSAGRGEVWVNPGAVAFWLASEPSPQPDPQESHEPATKRQTVTDMWGNPLRKRPRR